MLIGTRYVKICCRTELILGCRISFLIIVLPVYPFLYTYFKFFARQSGINSRKIICGLYPRPASGIRLGFSGNTANADGIRPGHFLNKMWCPGFFFLQVLGKPVSIKGDHLVQYLIPVPIPLGPFFDYVPTGKI